MDKRSVWPAIQGLIGLYCGVLGTISFLFPPQQGQPAWQWLVRVSAPPMFTVVLALLGAAFVLPQALAAIRAFRNRINPKSVSTSSALRIMSRMQPQPERSISVLASEELRNVNRHLGLLGDDGYQLVTMVEALYDTLPTMCRFPLDVATNDDAHAAGINAHLMMISRRQLTVGVLTLMRGYRVDALAHLRKAVELCAVTVKMAKHPHMSRTWLEAGNSEAAWEKFRDKFTKLWPDNDLQLKSLEYTFDEASKAMHSSVYSVAQYLSAKRRVDGFPNIGVFDLTLDATFYAYFIRFIDCHLTILALFQRILKEYTGDTSEWLRRLEETKVEFSAKYQHWMPTVATVIKNGTR